MKICRVCVSVYVSHLVTPLAVRGKSFRLVHLVANNLSLSTIEYNIEEIVIKIVQTL